MPDDNAPTRNDPSSQADRLDEIIAGYLRAIESGDPPSREELLTRHPDLADELREFFADHDRLASLARPLFEPTINQTGGMASPERIRYFGDYELLEEIARGGMGVVYKARQVRLNRVVAVKMILSGQLASPADVERFHTEAEAAAKLDHPGIVPIYEVGDHDGQHYFSMGFVEGPSLSTRVAQGPLPAHEAAEIVRTVAEAVQYAHENGVIHRDLKPGNVLLDRHGKPRITDFGLAKLTGSHSDLTGTGQVLGTPGYMPPEQAAAHVGAVGPLSDIYSLGAILYCLLTGRPPFQAASPIETLLQVQKQEPVAPRQLNPAIPLDLDTIVLKCLEKSPARRYSTAQEVADELERFLDGRPIVARPVGSVERTWRWCRRNPVVAGLMSTVAASLIAGTAISTYFAVEANDRAKSEIEQRKLADKERQAAILQESRAVAAQQQSAESLKDALAAVDQMLTRVAQERLVNVPQMEPVRKELMEDALRFYQKFLQKNKDDPLIFRETAGAYRRLADIYRTLGRNADAEECFRRAFEMFEVLEAQSALGPSIRRDLSTAHLEAAGCYLALEQQSEWEEHNRRAVEIAEMLTNEFPNEPLYSDQFAYAATLLSEALASTRPEEAERILKRSLTLAKNPLYVGVCHKYYGFFLAKRGRFFEAEPMFRRALEIFEQIAANQTSDRSAQWHLGDTLHSLASALANQGQLQGAEALNARAIVILDELATDYPTGPAIRHLQATAHDSHALLKRKLNRTAEAEENYRRALDLFEKLAADFPAVNGYPQTALHLRLNLGQFLWEVGQTEDALDVYRQGMAAANVPAMLNAWQELARRYTEMALLISGNGRNEEAERVLEEALLTFSRLARDDGNIPACRDNLARIHHEIGVLQQKLGDNEDAEKNYRQAIAIWINLADEAENGKVYRVHAVNALKGSLATLLTAGGRAAEAELAIRQAIADCEELDAGLPGTDEYRRLLGESYGVLGKLFVAAKRIGDAEEVCSKALESWPDNAYLLMVRSRIYTALRQPEKALADISQAIELAPDAGSVPWWYAERAEVFAALQLPEKQLAELSRAIELWPNLIDARVWRARFNFRHGEWDRALADFSKALELNPQYGPAWHERGEIFAKLGQWDRAVADQTKAIELGETRPEAWLAKATAHENLGQPDQALNEYIQLVELHPGYLSAAIERLKASGSGGTESGLKRALALYSKLVDQHPDSLTYRLGAAGTYTALSELYASTGKPKDLEAIYRDQLPGLEKLLNETSPVLANRLNLAWLHNHLGWLLRSHVIDRSTQAEEEHRMALELIEQLVADSPSGPLFRTGRSEIRYAIATLMVARGELAGARPLIEQATALAQTALETERLDNPSRERLCHDLRYFANVFLQLNDPAAAEETLRRAYADWEARFAESPRESAYRKEAAQAHATLVEVLLQQDKPAEAGQVAVTLQAAEYRAGNWKESIAAFEKATELSAPPDGDRSFYLAMARWQLGNKDHSRTAYDEGTAWIERNKVNLQNDPRMEKLTRLQAEAGELLGIKKAGNK